MGSILEENTDCSPDMSGVLRVHYPAPVLQPCQVAVMSPVRGAETEAAGGETPMCFLVTPLSSSSEESWGLPSKVWIQLLIHPYIFLLYFFMICTIKKNLYWICYNIASVSCFGFLATRHVGSSLPDQGWNWHLLPCRVEPQPLDCWGVHGFLPDRKAWKGD